MLLAAGLGFVIGYNVLAGGMVLNDTRTGKMPGPKSQGYFIGTMALLSAGLLYATNRGTSNFEAEVWEAPVFDEAAKVIKSRQHLENAIERIAFYHPSPSSGPYNIIYCDSSGSMQQPIDRVWGQESGLTNTDVMWEVIVEGVEAGVIDLPFTVIPFHHTLEAPITVYRLDPAQFLKACLPRGGTMSIESLYGEMKKRGDNPQKTLIITDDPHIAPSLKGYYVNKYDKINFNKDVQNKDKPAVVDLMPTDLSHSFHHKRKKRSQAAIKGWETRRRNQGKKSESFEADFLNLSSGTALGNYTAGELAESSAIHGDFDHASLNFSGHQNLINRSEEEEDWPEHECVTCMEGMDELVAKGQSWSCECCGLMVGTEDDHKGCGQNIDGIVVCNYCYQEGHKVTTMITLDGNEVIFNSTCEGWDNEKRFGDREYEVTNEYVFGSEEGSTPVMDPMEFGEMANWTPLDGSEGLKRKRAETFEADFDYYYSFYDKARGMEILDRLRTMNPETKSNALDWLIDNGYLHSEEVYDSAYINAMGDALYITSEEDEDDYDAESRVCSECQIYGYWDDNPVCPMCRMKNAESFAAEKDAYMLAYNQGFDDARSQRKISKTIYIPEKAYQEDEKLFGDTYRRK